MATSILDRSIRLSVDSCDEAVEERQEKADLHRACSRDTLDGTPDEVIQVCYSTDNLLAGSSSMQLRPFKSLTKGGGAAAEDTDLDEEEEDGLPGSRERMMSYEVNNHTDSEDDDDIYDPEWKEYEDFQEGVLDDQQNNHLPISESKWMLSTDRLTMDGAQEWDLSRRMGRKRHYRLGQMSSDLEDLVKQLDVIPAKIRRMDSGGGEGGKEKE